ncbi:MAG: hypothetical protein U0610_09080 [bacterium]
MRGLASRWVVWLGVALCAAPSAVRADDDVASRVRELTAKIEASPRDASLYAWRADLHRFARDYDSALADCERARALAPTAPRICAVCGRVLDDAGYPRAARAVAETGLGSDPRDPELRLLRARALVKLGDGYAAWDDFSAVIAAAPAPSPDLYLERSNAVAGLGGDLRERALGGIDEGIARLGPLVTLELAALEHEEKLGRVEAALARIDRLAADAPRKETWLIRRAELLARTGREAEARDSFQRALAAIDALPEHLRSTRATQALAERARAALGSPAAAPAAKPASP